jgi:hypothetical protein
MVNHYKTHSKDWGGEVEEVKVTKKGGMPLWLKIILLAGSARLLLMILHYAGVFNGMD